MSKTQFSSIKWERPWRRNKVFLSESVSRPTKINFGGLAGLTNSALYPSTGLKIMCIFSLCIRAGKNSFIPVEIARAPSTDLRVFLNICK